MKLSMRTWAAGSVPGIIALVFVAVLMSGCALSMLEGASRSSGRSGGQSSGGASGGSASRPATSQASADRAIAGAVRSRFSANASLKTLNISVDTHDGIVTLRGQVNSVGQRNAAQLEASGVKGVKSVRNELTVR